jgi:hypothetical protein
MVLTQQSDKSCGAKTFGSSAKVAANFRLQINTLPS